MVQLYFESAPFNEAHRCLPISGGRSHRLRDVGQTPIELTRSWTPRWPAIVAGSQNPTRPRPAPHTHDDSFVLMSDNGEGMPGRDNGGIPVRAALTHALGWIAGILLATAAAAAAAPYPSHSSC